ncbi:acyl carrier protein [Synechococcus sp. UW69]|uniref:acyl carrier protein n=1 Tax=Synechococcus sp. UW69 TaxID=368493 RepID=UPI001FCC3E58|nr:phosphopantetheine-binding protein [Synechococcus sp. UW69]
MRELTEGISNKQQLEGRLVEILHRISGADPSVITRDARLMEDIGIDSLGFYEILIEADTCFGIRIQEEQLLQFKTVGDIQSHLESLDIDLTSSKTA